MAARTADPYRDLQVIDARAPRFLQGVTALVAGAALATGLWPLLALQALQLTAVLLLGRRASLPYRFYFTVVQPRLGEGPVEDARPVRFTNQLGATLLWSAALLHAAGLHLAGWAIAAAVGLLAGFSAATGICVGCALYRIGARLRGLRTRMLERVDLAELGVEPGQAAVIQFTHPLCSECQTLSRRLAADGRAPILVDVSKRPDLARKYGVAAVPLALAVAGDGRVAGRLG